MPVRVQLEDGGWLLPLPRAILSQSLQAMLEAAGEAWRSVELYVVRDGRMAEENMLHMGCIGPTNILSFPAEDIGPDRAQQSGLSGIALGMETAPSTLLLSVDTLRRECVLYGQDTEQHTLRLLAHGLGHVLGYDHSAAMDALCSRMWVAGGTACGLALATEDY